MAPTWKRRRSPVDPSRAWQLVREQGMGVAAAADVLGASVSGVSKAVNRVARLLGKPTTAEACPRSKIGPGRVGPRPRIDAERVHRMVAGEGLSLSLAAAKVGCSVEGARYALKRREKRLADQAAEQKEAA